MGFHFLRGNAYRIIKIYFLTNGVGKVISQSPYMKQIIFMRFPLNVKSCKSKILNQIIPSTMNRFYSGLICYIWQKDWSCIVYKLIVAKYIWQLRSVIPLMCVAESFIIIIPKQNVRNTESKNYAKYATTKFGNLTWHLGLIFWFWKNFLNVLHFHFF